MPLPVRTMYGLSAARALSAVEIVTDVTLPALFLAASSAALYRGQRAGLLPGR